MTTAWNEIVVGRYNESDLWYGDRGIFCGSNSTVNSIDYITISICSNAIDFGDMTSGGRYMPGAASNGTSALLCGGTNDPVALNNIDYVTFSTIGNSIDYGDLPFIIRYHASCSNGYRYLFAGGTKASQIYYTTFSSNVTVNLFGNLTVNRDQLCAFANSVYGVFSMGNRNSIDYVTISTLSNAILWGNTLTTAGRYNSGGSNENIGIFSLGIGGYNLHYITFATKQNSELFGTLTSNRYNTGACSNGVRYTTAGGQPSNIIDYVIISVISNAVDFGDLSMLRMGCTGCSGN